MVEETNVDMQSNVCDSVGGIRQCELYTTVDAGTSTPKVERKRCKIISCKNMFLLILTATVIGTLAGVVILYVAFTPSNIANGGYSDWGQWNTCTLTCGGGIQSRSRACTNPRPSPLGKSCEGDSLEVVTCNKVTCSQNIAFKAKDVTDISPTRKQTMIFETTIMNEGNAYSTSTGIFTAPVNGTYSFSTQFCVYPLKNVYIAIIVDGDTYATAYLYDNDNFTCDTADTIAVLYAQSQVLVKCIGAPSGTVIYESYGFMNSFSGYLVHQ